MSSDFETFKNQLNRDLMALDSFLSDEHFNQSLYLTSKILKQLDQPEAQYLRLDIVEHLNGQLRTYKSCYSALNESQVSLEKAIDECINSR